MKKLIITTLSIIAVCFAVNLAAAQEKGSDTPSDPNRAYIFRDHGGFVACFEESSEEPFLITGIAVKDLTPIDRVMLRAGVEVHGAREMSRTLEDYCS